MPPTAVATEAGSAGLTGDCAAVDAASVVAKKTKRDVLKYINTLPKIKNPNPVQVGVPSQEMTCNGDSIWRLPAIANASVVSGLTIQACANGHAYVVAEVSPNTNSRCVFAFEATVAQTDAKGLARSGSWNRGER